ncbi:MAG: NAD-dependent epimerase/dehydratase family protein [Candidatus Omnitrophica bacterium]|nr:NAD-dependent epimerase/dehydratase family protein [Candidatus Omnitrophota bacterium]
MKVLVIGGAGFIGANLVRRCLAEPESEVTVLDSLDSHLRSTTKNLQEVWDKIRFVKGDIRDETLIAEVIQGQDAIFNCAAQTSHPLSIQYPLLDTEINCLGNLKLLEAIRLLNQKAVIVYTSSTTIIGRAIQKIASEDHPENPLEIYSANKSVVEKYYKIYHTYHGLKTVVLRFANLYGPYGKGYPEFGFINYFISLAQTNKPIEIYGAGIQKRNVMFVEDATDILWRVSHASGLFGRTYLATGDEHLSVAEIGGAVVRVFEKGKVIHREWPEERQRIEIHDAHFSSARLRDATDWKPRYDFVSGLKKTREILEKQIGSPKV